MEDCDSGRGITELEKTRVSKTHRVRVARCYDHFVSWLARRGRTLDASDPDLVASLLANYIQEGKDSGEPIWRSRYAIVGVQWMHRGLKGHLKRAWDCIASSIHCCILTSPAPISTETLNLSSLSYPNRAGVF